MYMLRGSYRITITAKTLILQMLIFLIGTACGLSWKAYICNKKWDSLIFHDVKVSGLHLNSRSIKDDEELIKIQYIDPLMKNNIVIEANNKIYTLNSSKLIKRYDIKSEADRLPNLNEKLSLYEKSKLLKKGAKQLYNVAFVYDEDYIKKCIKAIEKDFNRQPVNASVTRLDDGNIIINPDVKGYKLEGDKLEEEIKKNISDKNGSCIRIKAPITEIKAAITKDKIFPINAKISSFTTNFSSSSYERSNNIELSTKLINGKILMPDEIFSFNDCVGERTKDRGFMRAPVLVGDKVDSGIGGGICQVSSTLYNAILRAGIKPIERTHHTLPSSYVELGLDATVDWKDIDFKFKNTLGYPIYIEGYTRNKNLYINIYSNSSLLRNKYVISSNVYKTTYQIAKASAGSNLSSEQAFAMQESCGGYDVKITRDTYDNDKLVKSEIISDDEYPAVPGIIKLGTRTVK